MIIIQELVLKHQDLTLSKSHKLLPLLVWLATHLLVKGPLSHKVQQVFTLGDDAEVTFGGGHNCHHHLIAYMLLSIVLPQLQGLCDVLAQLRVV